MIKILLYYKYTKIDNPQEIRDKQYDLCKKLNLKGRILIASEGINGTVGGSPDAVEKYMRETESYPEFKGIEWKISEGPDDAFPRLRVVVREEIVTLGLKRENNDVSLEHKAQYIEPEELLELYEKGEDFVIIDARNEYEARIGKFKNAIYFDIDVFKDLPKQIKKIKNYKDKLVVTYCTGGIRCEKFSAYLREQGFKNVRQLHGGIHRYSEITGGKNFEGLMYVFDGRVHVPVNHVNPKIISKCEICGVEVARYKNCENAECNKRFICCENCEKEMNGACSNECKPKVEYWRKRREEKAKRKMNLSN
ncbi:MAG: UPF0176 protein [Candidatus Dojkabacteria bacterium]|nr:MAG: UPF0176 protein [Candidatus Dojkabacteria bacterium]